MNLTDYLTEDQVLLELKAATKAEVLKEIADRAFELGLVPTSEGFLKGLTDRENLISTGIGDGIAIPHTRYEGPEKISILFARSKAGVDFDALDGDSVHIFITIVGPETADKEQLKILSRTARLLKQAEFRDRLLSMETPADVIRCIRDEEALI
ncbi:MAG: PTS sugar transporter subunit IIA [Candidatus Omnitrophica bacterium]|nr:PTS system fructose-specific EIIABC component [bacterium]NUN95410.1 PTS sugar transporter subunit IIA [Candidatus Omnitrophota bacterium]